MNCPLCHNLLNSTTNYYINCCIHCPHTPQIWVDSSRTPYSAVFSFQINETKYSGEYFFQNNALYISNDSWYLTRIKLIQPTAQQIIDAIKCVVNNQYFL